MSAVMPVERLRMRPWLENIINDRKYPGVEWVDEDEKLFRLPWKHASRNGWKINTDACLFRAWAEHTGKYQEKEKPNPKIWKANFRCALNSLPDMEEVMEKRSTKGNNAFKIYRITNKTNYSENKKYATKKYKGRHQRKRRSVSRRNSQKDTKPKIKDNTRQLTEEGEPLEVEATNNGLQFTIPAQELCGEHLMDHDYAQTRYFDIYEESSEHICEDINVPESKVVKTEPRSPGAKKLQECSLYEQEIDDNSKKCEIQHSSSEGGDKVMSYNEVIELIDELSSECESNGSLDTPMDDFTDDCMDNISPDFVTRKERANSAPAALDEDFTNLSMLHEVDINTKSKSISDLHSIMSTSAQEFLQNCLSGHG